MRRFIIFIVLLFLAHIRYGQSDNNSLGYGIYDQDNKRNDAKSSDTGSQNRSWLMNGGLDDQFRNNRIKIDTNYTHPKSTSSQTRTTSSSKGDVHKQNNDKKREYNARNDALRAQRAEGLRKQQEDNRRREEERKRIIEEENRLDRERGRQEYYMRTAGYHKANAMRDEWMRTEGVRRLEEDYKAIDMADIPERIGYPSHPPKNEVMSGKDMANLLRGKKADEGEITIEFVEDDRREDKHEVAICNESHFIELFDEGGYNQSSLSLWEQAMNSNYAIISETTIKDISNKYRRTVLISKDELDLSSIYITILPGNGCVGLKDGKLLLLENNKKLSAISLKSNETVEQIASCGSKIYGKQNFCVLDITDEKVSEFLEFETDNFTINPESNKTFIICANILGISILTRINTESMKYDELLRLKTSIQSIAANENILLVLSNNKIIQIDDTPQLYYKGESKINDLTLCNDSVLVATDKGILLLKADDTILSISKNVTKKIWCDGINIYALEDNGSLIKYTKKQ